MFIIIVAKTYCSEEIQPENYLENLDQTLLKVKKSSLVAKATKINIFKF